jgi:transcriptional regulator NrdR family protein
MRCPECKGEIIESRIVDEREVPVRIFLNCTKCQWEDEVPVEDKVNLYEE